MNVEKKRKELLAGAVMIVGVILLTAALILASNFSHFFEKKRLIRVQFDNIRGLTINNPVEVSGVEVGIVKEIHLATRKSDVEGEIFPSVIVIAQVPRNVFIPEDSRSEIDASLTGIRVLRINRGQSAT